MWYVFWGTVIVVAIVAELVALAVRGVPLTKVYLRLACSTFLRIVMFGFFFWMWWHWAMQPWFFVDTNGLWPVDVFFIFLGGLVGWKLGPPKWGIDCGAFDEV